MEPRTKATVLIVDDDPLSRRILQQLLAGEALDFLHAEDGEQALEMTLAHLPDVILLDVMMPRMDGFEVCRRLRAMAPIAEIPILMVTSLQRHDSRIAGLEAGADDFISKPYDPVELRARVGTITRLNRFRRLMREKERYRRLVELSPDGILITRSDGSIELANAAFLQLVGIDEDFEVVGVAIESFVEPAERERCRLCWSPVLSGEQMSRSIETEFLRPDGSALPVAVEVGRLGNDTDAAAQFIVRDISERISYQSQLERRANFDDLLGIPNRNLLKDRLHLALSQAPDSAELVTVALLNIDRLRIVNQSLGHAAGDSLLAAVARRIRDSLNSRDTLARFGGDVFAIIRIGVGNRLDAAFFAQSVLGTLRAPFEIDDQEIFVTASMGLSLYPWDARRADHLLRNAEAALFRAKREGGDCLRFYAREMQSEAVSLLRTDSALRRALERDELVPYYQPKVDLGTGRIVGAECLLRWRRDDDGLMMPGEFIPMAEETGLILSIGEWVLRNACRQFKQWQEQALPVGSVAVNVSARQFAEADLIGMVADTLQETGLDPARLELEVTETAVMRDAGVAAARLQAIRALGPRVSLDDFGTGYSSLSYLRYFKIDTLKIDQSFVANVTQNRDAAAIAITIINVAKALGHKVVAEGGETLEQMNFMRGHGCDQMQGYFFSQPLPAAEFESLVRSGSCYTVAAD